jgi:hypothetical protein
MPNRQSLADLCSGQYIYKLSKTHLKLTRTSTHVAFNLVFGANQPQQDRARSMFTAPPRPVQSPSPYPHGVRNEAARKSMGPPSSRPNSGLMIDPALTAPVSTPPNNRESSTQSAEQIREEKADLRETTLILQRLEEQDNKLSKMSESIDDWKIQNGRLLAALMRSSPEALTQHDTSGILETLMDDFEFMVNTAYEARSGNDELEILRAENESMKAKLQTIALAMGSAFGDSTPASQHLTSPMTASSTPSVLGKRKRIDARSRHSLLQNEVSFTDDDDLNDQSGLYTVSNATNRRSTLARQSERPSTPLLSSARVSRQYRQSPATTTVSSAKHIATPTGLGQILAKTSAQIPTPPDSSFAEQHGRESRSTEPDHFLDVESEYSGNMAPEFNGRLHEANADSDIGQNTCGPEIAERQLAGTMTVADAGSDRHEISSGISRPQRARKPTPKIATATDTDGSEYVAGIVEMRQKSGPLPTEADTVELHSRETRASAANASRRKTTSVLPEEVGTEQERLEINREQEPRRQTTNTLSEKVNVHPQDRGESSRPMKSQHMTRAAASQAEYIQETGNASGYTEVDDEISDGLAEDRLRLDSSMMTIANDEEPEELFQRRQDDQHEIQMNGNNKENEQPYYAPSADSAQSKQSNRRNRDPNKPKRVRRKPGEIERKYKCLFPGCEKAYGELPHLNTHVVDSSHGERWVKADYLEASKKQGDNIDNGMEREDSMDFDRLAEERNAEDALAAMKRSQERVDRVEKIRQRDRMAKEAMEREEMMELMNEG